MIDMVIEFPLPEELLSLNKLPGTERGARAHRARKNAWFQAAYYAAVAAFPGKGPSERALPPCEVYVSLPVRMERRRDPGNFTLTTKPILDAFVVAGLWPDDNPEWVSEQLVAFRLTAESWPLVIVRLVERA